MTGAEPGMMRGDVGPGSPHPAAGPGATTGQSPAPVGSGPFPSLPPSGPGPLGARPIALAVAFLFLVESLVAKSHALDVGLSTPLHIALTALLGLTLVALSLGRGGPGVPAPVRLLLWLLLAWALLSAATADRLVTFNLLFAAVWAVHFAAIWSALPRVFRAASYEQRALFVLLLFLLATLLSVAFFKLAGQGRAGGFFASATTLGRISALASILAFALWLGSRRPNRGGLVLLMGVSVALLLASRTRASIGAAVAGCAAVGLTFSLARSPTLKVRASTVLSTVLVLLLLAAVMVDYGVLRTDEYVQFFRLSGGVSGVLGARTRIWQAGLKRLGESGLTGAGFAEKFGGEVATKWGIEYPTYDWTAGADPHNMFLTTAMQLGLPAMALLALLLGAIGWSSRGLEVRPRAVVLGVLTAGLVFGALDGNWFISFSPADRLSMTTIAIMLSCPPIAAEARGSP